jgi:Ca2+-binding RTX toxin-like protein
VRRALSIAALALALAPAAARADSRVTFDGGELSFVNEDQAVANKLTVDLVTHNGEQDAHFYDDTDPNGITTFPTPPCFPGKTNAKGNPVELFCTASQLKAIHIDVGPNQDQVVYKADAVPVSLTGGIGTDQLTTGGGDDEVAGDQGDDVIDTGAGDDDVSGDDGNDTITTGDGNDRVNGGTGIDTISTGAGDDQVTEADGYADKIDCGDGNDSVTVDQLDDVTNCENVQRQFVQPVAGQSATNDKTPPTLQAGALTAQKVTLRRHTLHVAATSSEAGLIGVTGYLAVGGINDRLQPVSRKVATPGGGVDLAIKLTKRQVRLALGALRHHHKARAHMTVAATDAAGNTSRVRRFVIDLSLR